MLYAQGLFKIMYLANCESIANTWWTAYINHASAVTLLSLNWMPYCRDVPKADFTHGVSMRWKLILWIRQPTSPFCKGINELHHGYWKASTTCNIKLGHLNLVLHKRRYLRSDLIQRLAKVKCTWVHEVSSFVQTYAILWWRNYVFSLWVVKDWNRLLANIVVPHSCYVMGIVLLCPNPWHK